MLLFGVDRNVFPDHGVRPVIESHMTADAGTLQADLTAVPESPVHMLIAGDECSILSSGKTVDDFLGIAQVFKSCCGPLFR